MNCFFSKFFHSQKSLILSQFDQLFLNNKKLLLPLTNFLGHGFNITPRLLGLCV